MRSFFFDLAAVCNLGFSNFFSFLVASWVRTTNVNRHTNFIKIDQIIAEMLHLTIANFVKIGQTVSEITIFFYFQDSRHLPPPSWILKFLNFWFTVILGGLIYIAIPIFTEIGQTVADISHLTIFKMAAVRHHGFLFSPLARCEARFK